MKSWKEENVDEDKIERGRWGMAENLSDGK